jgi:hypothetical protein
LGSFPLPYHPWYQKGSYQHFYDASIFGLNVIPLTKELGAERANVKNKSNS